ncbi:hypothetical protein [Hymenobacter antarcticus]|uniref:Outer membrane protein beta-barrel domain-containing protein n=1 Tax=Hymenobacter antarcticus TaxID=486270 RepID=A0ABP7P4R8_9BACT
MKHFSFLALLFFKTLVVQAQNDKPLPIISSPVPVSAPVRASNPNSFQRYEWDVSVDASFVLPSFYQVYANGYYGNSLYAGGNGYYGYGYGNSGVFTNSRSTRLMLRKNETVTNATNIPLRKGAYRATLYLSGNQQSVSGDSLVFNVASGDYYFLNRNNAISLSTSLGYEWQHQVGKFQFFYGYDVFLGYLATTEEGTLRNATGRREATSYDYHSLRAGVSPVAGVKFFIHPRFSLSLESAYSFSYFRSTAKFSGPVYGYFSRSYTENGFSYGLKPVSAINATFHFGQVNP